eukprot:TRINITY_DN49243_c0_g1_i1.p1 TRINITY_DN49243_c0_g1~~TRINITY_DN49243_c0_g1_i1.p1  ORF type:complete len:324 (+),score=60.34 TRINITY_DN49243_c0_g1_i1:128-1099(+)
MAEVIEETPQEQPVFSGPGTDSVAQLDSVENTAEAEAEERELPTTPVEKAKEANDGKSLQAKTERYAWQDFWAPKMLKGDPKFDKLNAELMQIPLVKHVVETVQVTPVVVTAGLLFFGVLFLFYGFGGQAVCTLLGIAYPAFESFKAVEDFANLADLDQSELYKKSTSLQFWLMYWIVVSMFTTFETFFYIVLVWLPFYYPLKVLVLLWLYMPQTRGANYAYHKLVSPYLRRNRHHIDSTLSESHRQIRRSLSSAAQSTMKAGISTGAEGLGQLKRRLSAVGPLVKAGSSTALELLKSRSSTDLSEKNEPEPELASSPEEKTE